MSSSNCSLLMTGFDNLKTYGRLEVHQDGLQMDSGCPPKWIVVGSNG
jgi:hypothetical protein